MYSEKEWKYLTFYEVEKENTDKIVYGNISEAIKVGNVNGTNKYEFDNWSVQFVGGAYELAKTLKNKEQVNLLKYEIRNRYSPTHKKSYPTVKVFLFEKIAEKESNHSNVSGSEDTFTSASGDEVPIFN